MGLCSSWTVRGKFLASRRHGHAEIFYLSVFLFLQTLLKPAQLFRCILSYVCMYIVYVYVCIYSIYSPTLFGGWNESPRAHLPQIPILFTIWLAPIWRMFYRERISRQRFASCCDCGGLPTQINFIKVLVIFFLNPKIKDLLNYTQSKAFWFKQEIILKVFSGHDKWSFHFLFFINLWI